MTTLTTTRQETRRVILWSHPAAGVACLTGETFGDTDSDPWMIPGRFITSMSDVDFITREWLWHGTVDPDAEDLPEGHHPADLLKAGWERQQAWTFTTFTF